MFIKQVVKRNSSKGKSFTHYRLVESYRIGNKARHRTILNLGDVPLLEEKEHRKTLANRIDELINKQNNIFPLPEGLERLARKFYAKIIDRQHLGDNGRPPAAEFIKVDINSLGSENIREIGAEWMCKQMAGQLGIKEFLIGQGWNGKWASLGEISIISKAIFASSEHKTADWLSLNSGLLELYGSGHGKVNRHQLYKASSMLYENKQEIERYFSTRTQELFDLHDKIILYDLTNTYFEGRKQSSKKARFGRSKEKRNDARLMVLAVVVDVYGFVKYSRFYEGNMSDSKTLLATIEEMEKGSSALAERRLVIIDAGIGTEDNLKMLKARGYDYLCVSRKKLKNYRAQIQKDKQVSISDKRGHAIELQKIVRPGQDDTFLYVRSEQKQAKEASMDEKFTQNYINQLQAIQASVDKKGGVKRVDKVWERIGRLKQKYPRANKYFDIKVDHKNGRATGISWQKIDLQAEQDQGVYFLRTTLNAEKESTLWHIYNTLKEIEATFRILKTDLNLRPVYHQKDIHSEAHLFLGILAYQIVCSIRHRLKQKGIHYDWQNIVRIMNTQKVGTTSMKGENENYFIRHCSRPAPEALGIYQALGQNSMPFMNKKSVVPH